MKPAIHVAVTGSNFERIAADVALVGFFANQRPLRGGAGRADWRLCGLISDLLADDRLDTDRGAAALLPTAGALVSPRLLLVSLGEPQQFDRAVLRPLAHQAFDRVADLGARRVVVPLPLGGGTEDLPLDASAVTLIEASLEAVRMRSTALELVLCVSRGTESVIASVLQRLCRGRDEEQLEVVVAPEPDATPGDALEAGKPSLPPGVGSAHPPSSA
jgi:hypothetical protein